MDSHIFISYARQDGREYAERLDNDLASADFVTWRDTRSINEYQDFSAEIENAIRDASHVAVCITPSIDANPHSFVRREIIYADSKEKPIIPLVFPNADVPTLVNHLTWIAFGAGKKPEQTLNYEDGFSQLLARLKTAPQPTRQRESSVPYREYLKALYDRIVDYLNQTVFSLITLNSEATPGAVEEVAAQALPMAFFDMAGIGGKQDETIRFQSFYEAFDKYGGRALLLGGPGAGKTTTLMAFARDAVWRRLENPALPLPLLAPIATWDAQKQTPLTEWLVEAIPMLKQDEVARLIAAGNALLVLDGLDELGDEREDVSPPPDPLPATQGGGEKRRYDPRQRFMEIVPENNQVVVTCRVKDYAEIGEKIELKGAVTLQALNDEQMREYLREMPDLWAALEADNELRDVARTPLLLSLFTYAFAGLDEEAKKLRDLSRGDLRDKIFESYVRRRYEHEERKLKFRGEKLPFTLEEIYEVLGRLAMHNAATPMPGTQNILNTHNFTQITRIDVFIKLAVLLNILVQGTYDTVHFVHLLMRDYFAFEYAIYCLNSPIVDARKAAVWALGRIADTRSVPMLLRVLKDPNDNVRKGATWALMEIQDTAVERVIEALDTPVADIRIAAVQALEGSWGLPAIDRLIALLSDKSKGELGRVCDSAAKALTRIGTPEALAAVARWREQGQSE